MSAERPIAEMSLGRKPWQDLRPVILAVLYLALSFALGWSNSNGLRAATISHSHIGAGLGLGLLLMYGLSYTPIVLVAGLLDDLWRYPVSDSVPLATLHCFSLTLVIVAAAALLRHIARGPFVSLRYGRDVTSFLATGFVTAAALSAAATGFIAPAMPRPYQWPDLAAQFVQNLTGFGIGILALTPFLLIHARPWLDTLFIGLNGERTAPGMYFESFKVSRPVTLFGFTFLALAGAGFWLILTGRVSQALYVFLLFSLPLVLVAIRRGLEGLSIAVPILTAITGFAYTSFGKDADAAGLHHVILLVASLNAYAIGTGVTQLGVTGKQAQRRDAILDAVSYAAQQFLGKGGWESGLQTVMKRVGEATSVTRVFISERLADGQRQAGDGQLYEWTANGVATDDNDRRVLNLLRGQLIDEQSQTLSAGDPIIYFTQSIDHKKRDMLQALGVRSAVIVPMFVDRQWWGCLGLEQCFVEREWPEPEIDGLKIAGHILGTLIASVRVENQFRQLTGNIQAVFWISSPDGRSKQYVSPGYEEIWGRSSAKLQQQPASWLDAIHEEDHDRVREALVKQAWGEYDEEYRVVRPDRSIRWVRDRAFPVRDQAGQVYRTVGIAEDITRHKQTEEQLRTATDMLSTLIDHLISGIVVEDENRRITRVNQSFSNMFSVPVPPQSLCGVDSRLLFLQSAGFANRIEEIIKARVPVLSEEIQWQERVFMRNYIPVSFGENFRYHLWQYRDVTDSRAAEEQIKASLKEKEVLLKEIHHRVKNNLQIICSLLSLQGSEIIDPQACQRFKESKDRVKAMALIHERLYQSGDLAKIDFAGYVQNLTGHLMRSYRVNANAIRLSLEVDPVPMNLDVAIPCGLMINELVSNALKYAFRERENGGIVVRFSEENDQTLRLLVKDNGVGIPDGTDPEASESLGLKLVKSLTEQLDGRVAFRNQDGFECEIRVPRSKLNGSTMREQ